ncbi:hypothetical protein [Neobacillus sp. LXY-4]|uniref:hypothetical protein n=1 Tax=Neobacillus sp. LXY-4 TaxID=3379826 RepID=UPI003EDE7F16
MGIYRTICNKVEDVMVHLLTKKQKLDQVKTKVELYRKSKEAERAKKRGVGA